ncbi:MFS transporter [Sphaerisporangium fuscum]|uniref:MFS transporter n=1 Tax=Sphaerisporangium fuscum TaxID=2835868 RepID=UPI001BDC0FCC|nr:MFS transporter [Sphaerisporangium fuscum]
MFSRIVPQPGPPRMLALAQLANSVGDGAYYVCSALYFTRVIGLSPAQVGFGLTLGWAVGAVAGIPLGHLADRRGPRGTAALLAAATGVAVCAYLFVSSFAMFLVAACLYACCQCGLSAVRQALLAGLIEAARRTEVRAHLQSAVNAGLAAGAALGGLALRFDTREAYLAVFAMDAAGFVISALLLLRLPVVPPSPPRVGGEPVLAVLRDRPYALVSLLNTVMLLYMPLLSLVIPLWVAQRTEAASWMVAAPLVLNTLGVMLFQVRVARRVTGLDGAARSVRRSGLVMLAACAAFALSAAGASASTAAAVLLVAASLQVVGEMMLASGAWEIGFGLAPRDKQGQYQGFFGTGTAVARMIGPVLLTTLIMDWGVAGWLLLGGLFAVAGWAMGPAVAWARRAGAAASGAPRREDLGTAVN